MGAGSSIQCTSDLLYVCLHEAVLKIGPVSGKTGDKHRLLRGWVGTVYTCEVPISKQYEASADVLGTVLGSCCPQLGFRVSGLRVWGVAFRVYRVYRV